MTPQLNRIFTRSLLGAVLVFFLLPFTTLTCGGAKLVTMHSSKGLEFPFVLIPGIGQLPTRNDDEVAAARLLYVAMTRATERLLLAHHGESVFSARIRASINVYRDRRPELYHV